MIHVVVRGGKKGEDYSWRFIMDPLDRHLEIIVPDQGDADLEFIMADAALICAVACRSEGHTKKNMANDWESFQDVCPELKPYEFHIGHDSYRNVIEYVNRGRITKLNEEAVLCLLRSMKSK